MAARALAALMLRTERGPLRPLWRLLTAAVTRATAARLARRGASVYVRGSFASPDEREPAYGLSDVDLVVVRAALGDAAPRPGGVPSREGGVPQFLRPLIATKTYAADELADVAAATVFEVDRPIFTHDRSFSLRTRPDLYGPTADWRLVRGPDVRPRDATGPDPRVAAWLELQCWWRYAAHACLHPDDRHATFTCFKLVAESARIWLWLVHGERASGRIDALERALPRMPEDEHALRLALDLRTRLHRPAPLDEIIAWLVGFSSRLARRVSEGVGWTEVELRGGGANGRGGSAFPHLDWRALVMEDAPPATFLARPFDATSSFTAAAAAEARGQRVALTAPDLLLFPSADLVSRPFPRGNLRCVQCAASDPVSFALVSRETTARFSDIPGWTAADWARRAVQEQRARDPHSEATARAEAFAAARILDIG